MSCRLHLLAALGWFLPAFASAETVAATRDVCRQAEASQEEAAGRLAFPAYPVFDVVPGASASGAAPAGVPAEDGTWMRVFEGARSVYVEATLAGDGLVAFARTPAGRPKVALLQEVLTSQVAQARELVRRLEERRARTTEPLALREFASHLRISTAYAEALEDLSLWLSGTGSDPRVVLGYNGGRADESGSWGAADDAPLFRLEESMAAVVRERREEWRKAATTSRDTDGPETFDIVNCSGRKVSLSFGLTVRGDPTYATQVEADLRRFGVYTFAVDKSWPASQGLAVTDTTERAAMFWWAAADDAARPTHLVLVGD